MRPNVVVGSLREKHKEETAKNRRLGRGVVLLRDRDVAASGALADRLGIEPSPGSYRRNRPAVGTLPRS